MHEIHKIDTQKESNASKLMHIIYYLSSRFEKWDLIEYLCIRPQPTPDAEKVNIFVMKVRLTF